MRFDHILDRYGAKVDLFRARRVQRSGGRSRRNGGRGGNHPPRFSLGSAITPIGPATSFNWGHHSPGSDDAFPTPFFVELIVVIVLCPFLTAAFVLFFATVFDFAAVFAPVFALAFASPKPKAKSAPPLTITLMFPSALINRGAAMPPIKLINVPSTTAVFTKLVNLLFYRKSSFRPMRSKDTVTRRLLRRLFWSPQA